MLAFASLGAAGVLWANAEEPYEEPFPPALAPLSVGPTGNEFALTWYSFQDNTPSNSAGSSSGRPLVPFVSAAVPFRLLRKHGGPLAYGDALFVEFLRGRAMPGGGRHTGWVRVDDFCGDGGDDSYCFQAVNGRRVPTVDLYIGDIAASGHDTTSPACDGPAGRGAEPTRVFVARPPPAGAFPAGTGGYGGRAQGSGACGDAASARRDHGACYFYEAPASSKKWCRR